MPETAPKPAKTVRKFIKTARARRFAAEIAKGRSQSDAYLATHPEATDLSREQLWKSASQFARNPAVINEVDAALQQVTTETLLSRQKAVYEAQAFYDHCIDRGAEAAAASAMRLKFAAAGVDTERQGGNMERGGLQAIVDRLKLFNPSLAAPAQALIEAKNSFSTGDLPVIDAESAEIPERNKAKAGSEAD